MPFEATPLVASPLQLLPLKPFMIEFKNIKKSFDDKVVLDDVSHAWLDCLNRMKVKLFMME